MVLGFLAVEGPGYITAETSKIHGNAGGKGNAFVGRPENHVEFNAAFLAGSEKRLSVEGPKLVKKRTGIEEPGIEEIGGETSGLGFKRRTSASRANSMNCCLVDCMM